jgi:UDP-N-acetylmuramoyl-tripeptide--D-alanyl-D-alanine ligase
VDTRYLVLEYSARGRGHIAALCRIAAPRIATVLNVGSAHLGEFGSRPAIAVSKQELVEALPAAADGGVAVLNADDPLVLAMAARTTARVVTVGESAAASVRAVGVRLDDRGRPAYRLVTPAGEAAVRLCLYGAQHVPNSLAAAAVALESGLPVPAVAAALGEARQLSRWRMEVTERPDGVLVVNDAYNANPESMRAALTALATMSRGRRSWAVLGHMAELGVAAEAEHEALGRVAATLGVDRVVVVGAEATAIAAGASREGSWRGESVHVPDVRAAIELVRRELRPGDVVLVKASRAAGLERVALALAGDPGPRPGPPMPDFGRRPGGESPRPSPGSAGSAGSSGGAAGGAR